MVRKRIWPVGRMAYAEDCKSFYIGSIPVPASKLFRLSSAVEQSAVNRLVVGSNPTVGANKKRPPFREVFFIATGGEKRINEKLVRRQAKARRKYRGRLKADEREGGA